MRILLELKAEASYAYQKQYHHNLRGIFYNAFKDTQFEGQHDKSSSHPFTFSNIFPWEKRFKSGEKKNLIVASNNEKILGNIVEHLKNKKYFDCGEMRFKIINMKAVYPDVGRVGSVGTIRTPTGILSYTNFYDEETEKPYTHWNKDASFSSFKDTIEKNAKWKFERYASRSINEQPPDCELFSNYNFKKEFAIPIKVTNDYERTFILSDWEFKYEVQTQKHRKWLNTLLDIGVGWRNQSGIGFINIVNE